MISYSFHPHHPSPSTSTLAKKTDDGVYIQEPTTTQNQKEKEGFVSTSVAVILLMKQNNCPPITLCTSISQEK